MNGDETAGGAETTGAVKRAAAEVRDEMPTCGLCSDDRCTPCMDDAERYARAALTAALDAVDWPDEIAGHMTIPLTDMHRCACHAPLAPSDDRYMAEQAHLTHLSGIIRAALLGGAA